MSNTTNNMLKKLLLHSRNKSRLWVALVALCTGTTLLLLTVLIWWNFRELLYGRNTNDSMGSTFLIIGKKVTDQNMGVKNATIFTDADINEVKHAPQVQDVGMISSNHFPVYAMMGGSLAFATDLPLESVPDNFIDKLPKEWVWHPGDRELPIIVSSQFLDIYNYVFAPSQGLPQLSETSVKAIALNLKVGGPESNETVIARVVGFSDRIGSVLAPQSFIDYGNNKYGKPGTVNTTSQLILKTGDPSDTKFSSYIEQHNYTTNSQNLRWSKMRAIVEIVTTATGVLALLLMGISTLVFILFIELTIAHAQASLTLLMQIGYSPKKLSKFMSSRFLPLVMGTLIVSALITIVVQYFACVELASSKSNATHLIVPTLPGWPVWAALAASAVILVVLISRSVSGAIRK